jgi:hypothetical protein
LDLPASYNPRIPLRIGKFDLEIQRLLTAEQSYHIQRQLHL